MGRKVRHDPYPYYTATVIHLRAPNDVNGNPQRLFVVLSSGELHVQPGVVGAADEGYSGEDAVELIGKGLKQSIVLTVNITAGEYRALKRQFASRGLLRYG